MSIKKHVAFTLAEVLITLGIIGVVAALTIPTLINNYHKTQYTTALKKAYTQLNQVLLQMAVDNGTPDSIIDYFGTTATAGNAISSHFKVLKNCKENVGQGCFAKYNSYYDGSSATYTDVDNIGWYEFITMDNTAFVIRSFGSNCTDNYGFSAAPDTPTYNGVCGMATIDVNGLQEPNCLGRDVFMFYITSNKVPLLYPLGGFYNTWLNSNTGTTTTGGAEYWNYNGAKKCSSSDKQSGYCAGRIMEKGWIMDY